MIKQTEGQKQPQELIIRLHPQPDLAQKSSVFPDISGVSRQAAGCPAMSMLAAGSHRSTDLRPAFEIQAWPADFMDFINPR
jgi:hypothetical protein